MPCQEQGGGDADARTIAAAGKIRLSAAYHSYGVVYGWMYTAFMLGASLSQMIATVLFDATGNYRVHVTASWQMDSPRIPATSIWLDPLASRTLFHTAM
jgi:hypothetical protein